MGNEEDPKEDKTETTGKSGRAAVAAPKSTTVAAKAAGVTDTTGDRTQKTVAPGKTEGQTETKTKTVAQPAIVIEAKSDEPTEEKDKKKDEDQYVQVNFGMFNPFIPVRRPHYIRRACKVATLALFIVRDIFELVIMGFAIAGLVFFSGIQSSTFSGRVPVKFMAEEEAQQIANMAHLISASKVILGSTLGLTTFSVGSSCLTIFAVFHEKLQLLKYSALLSLFLGILTLAAAVAGTSLHLLKAITDKSRQHMLPTALAIAMANRGSANFLEQNLGCCGLRGPVWSYCSGAPGIDGLYFAALLQGHSLPGLPSDPAERACRFEAALDLSANYSGRFPASSAAIVSDPSCLKIYDDVGANLSHFREESWQAATNGKLSLLLNDNHLVRLRYLEDSTKSEVIREVLEEAYRNLEGALDSMGASGDDRELWWEALEVVATVNRRGLCLVPDTCCLGGGKSACPGTAFLDLGHPQIYLADAKDLADKNKVTQMSCLHRLRTLLTYLTAGAVLLLWLIFSAHTVETFLLHFQYATVRDAYRGSKEAFD